MTKPDGAKILDAFRIATVVMMIAHMLPWDLRFMAGYPEVLWRPEGLFLFIPKEWATHDAISVLQTVFFGAMAMTLAGLLTRFSIFIAALTLWTLTSWEFSWGYVGHFRAGMVLYLFIMCAFPFGRIYSLDSLIFKKLKPASLQDAEEFLFSIQTLACVIYFSAGMSKLRMAGWTLNWATGDSLIKFLKINDFAFPYTWGNYIYGRPGAWLAEQPTLCLILSFAVLALELGMPLALFFKRLKLPVALGLFTFIAGNYVFLRVNFFHFTLLAAAFLPWPQIIAKLEKNAPRWKPDIVWGKRRTS